MTSFQAVRKMPLLVHGMHGMGDNFHQRAAVKQLMARHDVWLETPWPCLYHDLIAQGLNVISKGSSLRTQAKNAKREAAKFRATRPPRGTQEISVSYSPDMVRKHNHVLGAMCAKVGVGVGSFSLPVPDEWDARALTLLARLRPTKPVMIYRPLVERTEWGGCKARNPDAGTYAELFKSIRDQYFVISVADLLPGREWIASEPVSVDAEFHNGELDAEILCALMRRASLAFASPGFAIVMAQAVGAPSVCVFGGYENSTSFLGGAMHAPYLGIDPINPCKCFSHNHNCDKRINYDEALAKLLEFVNATAQPQVDSNFAATV